VQPVTANPGGASPYGALNMVGNVWEWVKQETKPSADSLERFSALRPAPTTTEVWYAMRGQSFLEPLTDESVLSDIAKAPARWKNINIGFRCVKDAK
jgi:formylglycine-generating enzyme required for sulfatase activity